MLQLRWDVPVAGNREGGGAVAMATCSASEQPKGSQHLWKSLPSHCASAVKKGDDCN